MDLEKINTRLIKLYAEMAELTKVPCVGRTCHPRPSMSEFRCCDPMYCEIARTIANEYWNVDPPRVRETGLLYMGEKGCTLNAHFRPACALHHCRINALGTSGDQEFDQKYFKLRGRIERLEWLRDSNLAPKS